MGDGELACADPEAGPHAHWHVPGVCDSPAWHPLDPDRPAEYWWLGSNGYWFSCCGECCARWRRAGERDPDLAAVRITTHR